ncbi:MAG: RluA family pseudouridine synthase [Candidatus Caenarcaniphilales bacterium]|nr:RluA family pseudouridine synthase [Candidatus Caenarcaniphilales bacterium]
MEIRFEYSGEEPIRLDVFLSEQLKESRSLIQKSIKKGLIFVNSKTAKKAGEIIENGSLIEGIVELSPKSGEEIKPENIPIEVVFEDEHLIVINKPAGLIVHPTTFLREGTLVNALLYRYQKLSDVNNEDGFRPGIVHRLDKDTSGLMIIAKSNYAHKELSKQLAQRTLKRIYWAIAIGNFEEDEGFIEAPIGRHPKDRKRMAVVQDPSKTSRYARTHWKVLERYKNTTLLEVSLDTGRTHQIRVHFEYINHPLLGDPVYGGRRTKTSLISHQALHAKKISFIHPVSGEQNNYEIPLSKDIELIRRNI